MHGQRILSWGKIFGNYKALRYLFKNIFRSEFNPRLKNKY